MSNVNAPAEPHGKKHTYAMDAAMILFLAFVVEAGAEASFLHPENQKSGAILAGLLSLCCIAIMARAVRIWRLKAIVISLPFAILAFGILWCAILTYQNVQ